MALIITIVAAKVMFKGFDETRRQRGMAKILLGGQERTTERNSKPSGRMSHSEKSTGPLHDDRMPVCRFLREGIHRVICRGAMKPEWLDTTKRIRALAIKCMGMTSWMLWRTRRVSAGGMLEMA